MASIDYSPRNSTVNRDPETGIRYGIIPLHRLGEFASESFEADYIDSCPECGTDWPEDLDTPSDCPSCHKHIGDGEQYNDEPSSQEYTEDGYKACIESSGDVWFFKSPYYTHANFYSPCAPGACYLTSPAPDGEKAYCPGPDWFDDEDPAPYPIYNVTTGELVSATGMV